MKVILLIILITFSITVSYANEILPSEIFLKRHSGKSFDPSRDVSFEQLTAMIEAARWAPSSHNNQPWNFIICERTLTPEAYQKAFSSLKPETQQKWAIHAPLLIVIVSKSIDDHKGKFNPWHEYDTGAAAVSMALQATDLGLMTHQIGGFNKEIIKQEFQLPENCFPLAIMVVGYESPDENPSPRERNPVGSNFFLGEWGLGLQ